MIKSEFRHRSNPYSLEYLGVAILTGRAKINELPLKINQMEANDAIKSSHIFNAFRLMVIRAQSEHPAVFASNKHLFRDSLGRIENEQLSKDLVKMLDIYSRDCDVKCARANVALLNATASYRHERSGAKDIFNEMAAKIRLLALAMRGQKPSLYKEDVLPFGTYAP